MMPQQDQTVTQLLDDIKSQEGTLNKLQESLVLRAELREITEMQYYALIELAKEGLEFLAFAHRGDSVGYEWIAKRDELVEHAQLLIQDAPL